MTKRFFALLMAVVMVLALSVPAFADVTIKAPDNDRTYEVYQIFTGDYVVQNNKEVLSNVKWGANGNGGSVGEVVTTDTLKTIEALGSLGESERAAELAKYVTMTNPIGTVAHESTLSVPTGYYLIKDIGEVADGETYSLYIFQVVGDTTINPKDGTTESDKTTGDRNDSDTPELTSIEINGETADYDIGDDVPFHLTAKVASDYARYTDKYFLEFNDTLSDGLNFNKASVTVTVDGKTIESGYAVTETTDPKGFNVTFEDLKAIKDGDTALVHADSVIVVSYTANLSGDGVVIGEPGNPNTMHITYSNNPNNNQKGKTPDEKVIIFTYELDVNKVDGENKPLAGASFELFKEIALTDGTKTWVSKGVVVTAEKKSTDGTVLSYTSTWIGVDDGNYKLVETVTPPGYNTINPVEFTISAEHDLEDGIINLTGTPFTASEHASGVLSGDIVNQSGSVLPETGGIGTTIFYVVGAVLVVGAAVILFAKKKVEE